MTLQIVTVDNTWDIVVANGLCAVVTGENELMQRATTAAYLQKNTIPMLPEIGNDWTKYILGEISLTEIDAQVRATVNSLMESFDFVPFYKQDGNRMTLTISRVSLTGAT